MCHPRADRAALVGGRLSDAEPSLEARVGEDRQQLRIARLRHLLEDLPPAVTVLHAGRGDGDREDQPEGVDEEVSLASGDLFPRVVAPAPPLFSATRTDWLSKMAALGWTRRSSF